MILSATAAIERLDHLARLFDHARTHASHDALALSEILDHAQLVIDELAPSVAAAKGGPEAAGIIRAARRAEQSHRLLTQTIGLEVARLAKELAWLSSSSEAAAVYEAPRRPVLRLLDRSA